MEKETLEEYVDILEIFINHHNSGRKTLLTTKEIKDFLLVSTVLVIVAALGGGAGTLAAVEMIGPYLSGIFTQLLAFVVPATIVVALKEVLVLAKQ